MFYRIEGDSVVYNGKGELIYYIPESYFSAKTALIVGEYVNLLGIFNYAIFDENGKHSGLKNFNFPSIFLAQPSSITKIKGVKLTQNSDKQDYRELHFRDGDKLIVNKHVPQSVKYAEELNRLFVITGKIPDTIYYPDIYKYFIDNIKINGASYGINAQLFGIMQSELCRDPQDKSRPFRLSSAKKRGEFTNYKTLSVKQVPNYVSVHSALTSENWDDSVVHAIMIKDKNKNYSPLEKTLTGVKEDIE